MLRQNKLRLSSNVSCIQKKVEGTIFWKVRFTLCLDFWHIAMEDSLKLWAIIKNLWVSSSNLETIHERLFWYSIIWRQYVTICRNTKNVYFICIEEWSWMNIVQIISCWWEVIMRWRWQNRVSLNRRSFRCIRHIGMLNRILIIK